MSTRTSVSLAAALDQMAAPSTPAEPAGAPGAGRRRRSARSPRRFAAATLCGPALVGLGRRRQQRGGRAARPPLAADGAVVVGRRGLAAPGDAARADAVSAAGARLLLRASTPGRLPAGGKVHLRLWLAERIADEMGAANLAGAPWMRVVRAGARREGRQARRPARHPARDRHPHAGRRVLDRARGRPAGSLDRRRRRARRAGGGRPGLGSAAAACCCPGADVGARAEIAPGRPSSAPCRPTRPGRGPRPGAVGAGRGPWAGERPAQPPGLAGRVRRQWPSLISLLPVLAVLVAGLARAGGGRGRTRLAAAAAGCWPSGLPVGRRGRLRRSRPAGRGAWCGSSASATLEGHHPVHGRQAWQAWSMLRLLDEARTWLFPLYSSSLTPAWLRALGAKVGTDVEASTVLLIPKPDHHQRRCVPRRRHPARRLRARRRLAADRRVKIGKHAFVGNSGMTAPGRKVPKQGLVAVLSAAPRRKQGEGGTSWLGSPPAELRRRPADTDDSRTYHPAHAAAGGPRAGRGCCRLLPRDGRGRDLARRRGGARGRLPTRPAGGWRPLARRAWC